MKMKMKKKKKELRVEFDKLIYKWVNAKTKRERNRYSNTIILFWTKLNMTPEDNHL